MILAFVVYQLVFSLLPLILLTLLIASQAYRLAVTDDPVGQIRLVNIITLLLFGFTAVCEISIAVLWRFVKRQVNGDVNHSLR